MQEWNCHDPGVVSVSLYLPRPSLKRKTQVLLQYLQGWLRKQFYKYEKLIALAFEADSKQFRKAQHKLTDKYNECAVPMGSRCAQMIMQIYAPCPSVRKELLSRKRVNSFFGQVRMCHFTVHHNVDELNGASTSESNDEERSVPVP